jgi:hypothetical protein
MAFPLLTLLVNPNAFFSRDSSEWEALRVPALIVLAAALIAGATAILTMDLMAGIMPPDVQQYQGAFLILGIVGQIAWILVFWVIWAGVFTGVSLFFQGKGPFGRTLAVTGYGHLPLVIGSVISLAMLSVFIPDISVPAVNTVEEIRAASIALMHHPVMILVGILGMIFLFWAANIWIFGIRYARGISLRNAAITVGVPVALYLTFTLWSLAGMPL